MGLVDGYYDGERIVSIRKWRYYKNCMTSVKVLACLRFIVSAIVPRDTVVQFYLADMFNPLDYTARLLLVATGSFFAFWATFLTIEFNRLTQKPELTFWMKFLPATQPLSPYKYVCYPKRMRRDFLEFSSAWLARLTIILFIATELIVNTVYGTYYSFRFQPESRWTFFSVFISHLVVVNMYGVQMLSSVMIMSSCMSMLCDMFSKRYGYLFVQLDRLATKGELCFRTHRPMAIPSKFAQTVEPEHCCVDLNKLNQLIIAFNAISIEMMRVNLFWSRIVFLNNGFGLILIVTGLFGAVYSESVFMVVPITTLMLMFYFFAFISQIAVAGQIVIKVRN
jgi:hypothetical protein